MLTAKLHKNAQLSLFTLHCKHTGTDTWSSLTNNIRWRSHQVRHQLFSVDYWSWQHMGTKTNVIKNINIPFRFHSSLHSQYMNIQFIWSQILNPHLSSYLVWFLTDFVYLVLISIATVLLYIRTRFITIPLTITSIFSLESPSSAQGYSWLCAQGSLLMGSGNDMECSGSNLCQPNARPVPTCYTIAPAPNLIIIFSLLQI